MSNFDLLLLQFLGFATKVKDVHPRQQDSHQQQRNRYLQVARDHGAPSTRPCSTLMAPASDWMTLCTYALAVNCSAVPPACGGESSTTIAGMARFSSGRNDAVTPLPVISRMCN